MAAITASSTETLSDFLKLICPKCIEYYDFVTKYGFNWLRIILGIIVLCILLVLKRKIFKKVKNCCVWFKNRQTTKQKFKKNKEYQIEIFQMRDSAGYFFTAKIDDREKCDFEIRKEHLDRIKARYGQLAQETAVSTIGANLIASTEVQKSKNQYIARATNKTELFFSEQGLKELLCGFASRKDKTNRQANDLYAWLLNKTKKELLVIIINTKEESIKTLPWTDINHALFSSPNTISVKISQ